jgi:hypothetical protein
MKIDFEIQTNYGMYRDALHLPDEHTLSEEEIAAMKLERVNNWVYHIENPPEEVFPSED